MPNLAVVGWKIQTLRKSRSMSQDELAASLSVSRQAVSQWENGQTAPSIDSIIGLHRLFSVPIDALLCPDEFDAEDE